MKAFPFNRKEYVIADNAINEVEVSSDGMDLRDYFAAMAMQALLSQEISYVNVTQKAYDIAEIMIRERNK